jgi:hypothetical protein
MKKRRRRNRATGTESARDRESARERGWEM